MTDTEFDALATKVLTGDASTEERSCVQDLVEKDPRWKVRYEELNQACGFVRKFGPLVDALHAAPQPVPEHRLAECRRPHNVRQ
jgi:hypothetical protein